MTRNADAAFQACVRADRVDRLRMDGGEEEFHRSMVELLPTPGSAHESWQLRQLRQMQRSKQYGDHAGPSSSTSSSSSSSPKGSAKGSKGQRRITYEAGPDGQSLETELYWRKGRLIWSRSGVAIRTFTYEEDVQQACWAWLDAEETWEDDCTSVNWKNGKASVQRALCIFLQSTVIIHLPHSGQEFSKRLDMEVLDVFPLDVGILVQRALEREDQRQLERMRSANDSQADDDMMDLFAILEEPLPNLFYLRRPLDELKAVQLVDELICDKHQTLNSTSPHIFGRSMNPSKLYSEVDERVIFVSHEPLPSLHGCSIVVTVSQHRSRFRVYALAHSRGPISVTSKTAGNGHARVSHGSRPPPMARTSSAHYSRPRVSSSTRGRMTSIRKSSRAEPAPRASVGGAPRTSTAAAAERSRISSAGMSRRVSGGLNNAFAHRIAGDVQMEGTMDNADDMQEVMQLLDEFDEAEEGGEAAYEPITKQSMSMRRSLSSALTNGAVTSAAANTGSSAMSSHIMRTPFAKGTLTGVADEKRSGIRARMSSAASGAPSSMSVDPFTAASTAATLGQRDEQSRMAQSSFKRPNMIRKSSELAKSVNRNVNKRASYSADAVDGEGRDSTFAGLPIFEQFGRGFAVLTLLEDIPLPKFDKVNDVEKVRAFLPQRKVDQVELYLLCPDVRTVMRRCIKSATTEGNKLKLISLPMENLAFGTIKELDTIDLRKRSQDLFVQQDLVNELVLLTSFDGRPAKKNVVELQHPQAIERRMSTGNGIARTVLDACDGFFEDDQSNQVWSAWLSALQSNRDVEKDAWEVFVSLFIEDEADDRHEETPVPATDTSSAWASLLQSSTHAYSNVASASNLPALESAIDQGGPRPKRKLLRDWDPSLLQKLLQVLNCVAQDCRLSKFRLQNDFQRLASFLIDLAVCLQWPSWIDYWTRLTGIPLPTQDRFVVQSSLNEGHDEEIYDVYEHLLDVMREPQMTSLQPCVKLCATTKMLTIFASFAKPASKFKTMKGSLSTKQEEVARSVLESMLLNGIGLEKLHILPIALALPLLECRQTCKVNPPASWTPEAFLAIGRQDLALQCSRSSHKAEDEGTKLSLTASTHFIGARNAGRPNLPSICYQLFSKDYRLMEVGNILQTSRAVAVKGPSEAHASEVEEDVLAEEQKRIFVSVSDRIKATSVGRGMFLLDSDPIRTAEQLELVPVCLRIRMLSHCIVQHREPDAESTEMEWPEFHNGAATALKLAFSGMQVESSWIHSQTKNEFTARHAGFIFGMGLSGQLRNLGKIHAHHYLSQRHPLTSIGLLLGIGISFAGSCDVMAKALMSIHLAHTLPLHSKPLKTTMLEQSAALVGLGYVFLGSNDNWASKMALKAMGTDLVMTDDDQIARRECFSLSAGLALGLTCLGKGREVLAKSKIEKEIVPSLERLIKRPTERSNAHDATNGLSSSRASDFSAFEWKPDISLTTSPASLALALIYLRSNRADMAQRLPLPTSELQLNDIRPDSLQTRVLCRSLIMWDDIRPTEAWIDSCLPAFLRFDSLSAVQASGQVSELAYWNMRSGALFALGLKFAGTNNASARSCLLDKLDDYRRAADARPVTYFQKVRQHAFRSAVDLILVCLAMVCAGSGDVEILKIIRKSLFRVDSMRYGNFMASTMSVGMLFLGGGRFSLASSDVAVASLLIAFYPRYPINAQDNRAHLQAYRHFWIMAVEARLLRVEDVESGETTRTPIKIEIVDEDNMCVGLSSSVPTPCVLPKIETIRSIELQSDRHFAAMLHIKADARHRRALIEGQTLFSMRLAAALNYEQDPSGLASLSAQADCLSVNASLGVSPSFVQGPAEASKRITNDTAKIADTLATLTGRTIVSDLVRALVSSDGGERKDAQETETESLMVRALLNCVMEDKLAVLPSVVGLFVGVRSMLSTIEAIAAHRDVSAASLFNCCTLAKDLQFLMRFASFQQDVAIGSKRKALLEKAVLDELSTTIDRKASELLERNDGVRKGVSHYASSIDRPEQRESVQGSALIVLAAKDVPSLRFIQRLKSFVEGSYQSGTQVQHISTIAKMVLDASHVRLSSDVLALFVSQWCGSTM